MRTGHRTDFVAILWVPVLRFGGRNKSLLSRRLLLIERASVQYDLVARLCRRWRICGLRARLVGGRISRVHLLLLLLLARWGEKRVLSLGSGMQ